MEGCSAIVRKRLKAIVALAVSIGCLLTPAAAPAGQKASPRPARKASAPAARAKPQVLGKLAIVHVKQATLRAKPEAKARVLSTVPRNTYLAITKSQGDYYGVLMVNRTTGWVQRPQVRIIPYQMAMSAPGTTTAPPRPPSPSPPKTPPTTVPKVRETRTQALLRNARSYLGQPQKGKLDASLFVQKVFASQGGFLPRYAREQANIGAVVTWANLEAGDRLYFDLGGRGRINHTGIYLGSGRFIHAAPVSGKVEVVSLFAPRYYNAILFARR